MPILPVNVQSRNSGLFYWFANWNTELRDMTVFHELLNKRGKTFRIRFGPLIPQERFAEGDAGRGHASGCRSMWWSASRRIPTRSSERHAA